MRQRHRRYVVGLSMVGGANRRTLVGARPYDHGDNGGAGRGECPAGVSGDTIKVGDLHSLSGTMAISEVTVKNAELMAIDEINAAGGVLGKKIEPVVEDGASDWPTFAEKAQKLISVDKVAVDLRRLDVGQPQGDAAGLRDATRRCCATRCSTRAWRRRRTSIYTGATTNQQIIPGLDYLKSKGKKKIFLVGSDYVFPRTANKEIKAYAKANGMEIVGEEYTPLGDTEYATMVNKIRRPSPTPSSTRSTATATSPSSSSCKSAGLDAGTDAGAIRSASPRRRCGASAPTTSPGDLIAWNYYQTTTPRRKHQFVEAYKAKYGADRSTDDPIEAGYVGVYLWAAAVEKAGSTDVEKVKAAAGGLTFDAPEGKVTIDGENQHIYKTARIGSHRGQTG